MGSIDEEVKNVSCRDYFSKSDLSLPGYYFLVLNYEKEAEILSILA